MNFITLSIFLFLKLAYIFKFLPFFSFWLFRRFKTPHKIQKMVVWRPWPILNIKSSFYLVRVKRRYYTYFQYILSLIDNFLFFMHFAFFRKFAIMICKMPVCFLSNLFMRNSWRHHYSTLIILDMWKMPTSCKDRIH